jgi:hypothetical protein
VPYAGTAADGTFAELKVDEVRRPEGLPPAQAASAGADQLVAARLGELGKYVLEPIDVAPFTVNRNGVTFGWAVTQFEGTCSINIEPGNFIAYYEPWDGPECAGGWIITGTARHRTFPRERRAGRHSRRRT